VASGSGAGTATVNFAWERGGGGGRVFDRRVGAVLLQRCVRAAEGVVVRSAGRQKNKWAPTPLATVEFQKRCSRWLRISSDQAMNVAEKLYQQGILSYPRTETDVFPDTMDLADLVGKQTGNPNAAIAGYATQLLQPNRMRTPRSGGHDDKAHPPIHPTAPPPAGLQGVEKQVYEFVARHFLACVSHDARGMQSEIILKVASETFRAHGSMVTERNYLDIYPWEKWANNTIPTFEQGQRVVPSRLWLEEGATRAPNLLTEADLIAVMDSKGIGTDATIADHIKTILDRRYAEKDAAQFFRPTELGRALLDGYDRMDQLHADLSDPQMRAKMEADMVKICRGERTKDAVVVEQRRILGDLFRRAQQGQQTLKSTVRQQFGARAAQDVSSWRTVRRSFSKCGACGAMMALKLNSADARKARALRCDSCDTAHTVPGGDNRLDPFDHRCPICQFQVGEPLS